MQFLYMLKGFEEALLSICVNISIQVELDQILLDLHQSGSINTKGVHIRLMYVLLSSLLLSSSSLICKCVWDIVVEIIMVYSLILSWIKGKDQVLTCMHEENLYNRIGNSTEENLHSFLVLFSYILYFLFLIENWIFNKSLSYKIP